MKKDLDKILKFQEERKWKQYHEPKNLAISLVLEASELLELFQWTKNNKLPKNKQNQISDEIADVYYYLLLIAHETGVDIKKAFREKMKKNKQKYPVNKAKGSSKKYSEL